ncbi:unnamed protein product [Pleuronectes platessa]|uniref:Uncharacterized protein n=1 Tax=Pleuronectes platessa TaxID=8262 RepID=A0A9N7UCD2_PLEPL|nr:unnamed protein product [Pleuronectes platessa]
MDGSLLRGSGAACTPGEGDDEQLGKPAGCQQTHIWKPALGNVCLVTRRKASGVMRCSHLALLLNSPATPHPHERVAGVRSKYSGRNSSSVFRELWDKKLFGPDTNVYAKYPVTGSEGLICVLCLDFVWPDIPGNGAYEWSRLRYR